MRIQFAKTDSDVISKRKGTYVPREQSKKKKKKKNKDKTKGKSYYMPDIWRHLVA